MMTWIHNIYQKFENMIQEVEDTMLEEFQFLENQMSIVGESVEKFYSTAMEDLVPPSTTSAPVLPIGHYTGISEKSLQRFKKSTMDSSINLDSCYSVKADNFKSRPKVESAGIESNVGSDVNQQNMEMPASETAIEANVAKTASAEAIVESAGIESIVGSDVNQQNTEMPASETAIEANVAKTASAEAIVESSGIESIVGSDVNQQNTEMPASETAIEANVAKTASTEATAFASIADCSNELENASTKQNSVVVEVLVESAEEKEENMSSFSSDIFEDAIGFSMIKAIQEDDDLNLDQTCVVISKDELQFAPNATINQKTSEKKWLQPFSLIKKSARKQEYEELALLHGKNEFRNVDCVERICPTLREDIFEPEWELL